GFPGISFAQSESTDEPGRGVLCQLGATAGARRYRPGRWGLVEFHAINSTDEMAEVQGVLRFVEDPTIQFSRRASIPPHSVFRSTCPVLVPESIPDHTRNMEVLTEQIEPPRGTDSKTARTPQEVRMSAKPILLDREKPTVGMISELQRMPPHRHKSSFHTAPFELDPAADRPAYEMVLAAKRAQNLSRRVSVFDPEDLPASPACLDVLDVLVLSSDRLAADPAGISMVRDWVLGGGVLWIMLDEVQEKTVSAVMGDAFSCSIVDRVQLTSFRLRDANALERDRGEQMEFESPVSFVRVVPEEVTTRHAVNGWPASFWQPFGAGKVYFTTLSPNAWMRPVTAEDPPPRSRSDATDFFPRHALQQVASACFIQREQPPLDTETLTPFLSRQIGYRILGRGTVSAVLVLFCLALIGAGWWCFRVGRPERVLWVAPVVAGGCGLFFLIAGTITKKSVPSTAATMSRVTLERGVGVGHSSGLVAIYNQGASQDRMGARRGGLFFPDMTAMSGRNRRITWTDEGAWHWEDLVLPPGVRTAPFQRAVDMETAMDCRARFGPDGLRGRLEPLATSRWEDAIIAVSQGNVMAVSIDAEGRFHGGPDDVLARDAYVSGSLLSDEQVRRGAIYNRLVSAAGGGEFPPRPLLHVWSDPWELGFFFPQDTRIDSTLVSIPVRLERTKPNSRVLIPAPFVVYRSVAGPDGRPSVAYSNMAGKWVECKLATTQWLRFQMPLSVLPLQLEKASLSLGIRAPSRSVEIVVPVGDELEVVRRWSHPIGTYGCTIEGQERLGLDKDGGLRLGVRVSEDEAAEPGKPMAQATWKIERVQLEVGGRVRGE
ncbi:MAG: hypothetical protein ACQESR_31565, partial [Planctomycetota bacterium]